MIRSGKDARHALTSADDIDWRTVVGLQIWAMDDDVAEQWPAPGGMDIQWMRAAGVRYAVVAVFEDDTWAWIDRLSDQIDRLSDQMEARTAAHRLAAFHDKPIQRGARSNLELRAAGY